MLKVTRNGRESYIILLTGGYHSHACFLLSLTEDKQSLVTSKINMHVFWNSPHAIPQMVHQKTITLLKSNAKFTFLNQPLATKCQKLYVVYAITQPITKNLLCHLLFHPNIKKTKPSITSTGQNNLQTSHLHT